MSGQPIPPRITEAFGVNADVGTITLPIPLTTPTGGAASFDKGFTSVNMTPEVAGGIPPFGQDFNGILYMLSSMAAYQQAGQPFLFDAAIAAAIGGYKAGTILGMSDGSGTWINGVDGNTTDPDNDGTASGWGPNGNGTNVSPVITGLTGGSLVLLPSQWRRQFIILEGALTSNLTIQFPPIGRPTYFINLTTGAFTVSVGSNIQSAPYVVVPQTGESSPTAVWGDGVNVFTLVPPITLPTSVSPVANTIPLRNNLGDLFTRYLNQSSAVENPGIANLFIDDGDGYLRKISILNFEAQVNVANLNGQVTNGQVPRAAVTQFFSNVQAAQGQEIFPDGTILKWGSLAIGDVIAPTGGTINFPTAFPTAIYQAYLVATDTNTPNNFTYIAGITNVPTVNGFTWGAREIASATQAAVLRWWAIGK